MSKHKRQVLYYNIFVIMLSYNIIILKVKTHKTVNVKMGWKKIFAHVV